MWAKDSDGLQGSDVRVGKCLVVWFWQREEWRRGTTGGGRVGRGRGLREGRAGLCVGVKTGVRSQETTPCRVQELCFINTVIIIIIDCACRG